MNVPRIEVHSHKCTLGAVIAQTADRFALKDTVAARFHADQRFIGAPFLSHTLPRQVSQYIVNSRERRAFLAQATSNLGEAIPLLAALLSIPSGERYPTLDVTPQKRKEKTLKALLAQVGGLAAQHAVLMVVEDVQWIDPASLELFDLIVDRVPSLPALLIITFRQEFMPPWIGRSHVTLLHLNRLLPRSAPR
jgi:hypothetical protein